MNVYVVYWEDEDSPQPSHRVADPVMRKYCEVRVGESAQMVADEYLGRFDQVTVFPLEMKTSHPFVFRAGMVETPPDEAS